MARKAAEFPVLFNDRPATLSFGETAVRLFDRSTFAMFKTFIDPTLLSVSIDAERLTITDGVDVLEVSEDGVALSEVASGFTVGARPMTVRSDIPIATTPSLPAREVSRVVGLVSGSSAVPAGVFDRLAGASRGALDGQAEAFGQDLSTAHRMAYAGMRRQAELGGADAVIGVTVTHESVGADPGFLLVTATGTAVTLAADDQDAAR